MDTNTHTTNSQGPGAEPSQTQPTGRPVEDLFIDLYVRIMGSTGQTHRKLANNTYGRIERDADSEQVIKIKYHNTDIVALTREWVEYNTGGFWTYTTKERINWYLPRGVRLYQERGRWWLWYQGQHRWTRFDDGMVLENDGGAVKVLGGSIDPIDPDKALRVAINGYVKGYSDEVMTEVLVKANQPMGVLGDCLLCRVERDGVIKREIPTDPSHLIAHIVEEYRFGTLLWNAMTWSGYNADVYLYASDNGSTFAGGYDVVRRSLRKYLNRALLHKGLTLPTLEELNG